ncbi:UNKNOWN [Stylonychia lemnae]|uniref:Uncharacterized protein n=1 Tax=Stylonychia lemnae TaxID=5949 RepID=A0A078AEV3_STYLE|nr:UNKNOWN [Stylonychia lemnae]|eukprot:CDW79413.1 UNKNOWN [Stylonychia lemnae]
MHREYENIDARYFNLPLDEKSPAAQFRYVYPFNFTTVAQAWILKFNYEPRFVLTSFANVQQLDEDRVQFYRRVDCAAGDDLSYEKIIINRADKTITSELIAEGFNKKEQVCERSILHPEGEDKVVQDYTLIAHQGVKTVKLELFKTGIERLYKTVKFAQFEQQSE